MQGLWGFYFADDHEAEDLAAKQPLTGPAAAAPFGDPQDAYAKGTLLVTRFYSFDTDSCIAVALFLAVKAHAVMRLQTLPSELQLQQDAVPAECTPDQPKSLGRRDWLMLPFAGWLANQAGQLRPGHGRIYLKEVIGLGAGSIVHRAILDGQELAFQASFG